MEERFKIKLQEMMDKKGHNSIRLTREKYHMLLLKIKETKMKKFGKTPSDYQRLKRYDVTTINGDERIICPRSLKGHNLRYFVHTDEVFHFISKAHLAIGHGGRAKMVKEVQKKIKNITSEEIALFLSLCEICSKRSKLPRKDSEKGSERTDEEEGTSRCRIDLINVHFQPDGPYKFILIYQDCATRFVQLRALSTDSTKEIAEELINIFTIFKAPGIIQSTFTWEMNNKIIEELHSSWKNLDISFCVPEGEEDIRQRNEDIEGMLIDWLEENMTDKWSRGLRFVQLMLNEKCNPSLKCSAFEAMFKKQSKLVPSTQSNQNICISMEDRHRYVKMEKNCDDGSDFHKDEII